MSLETATLPSGVSVVIPVYNSEKALAELVADVARIMAGTGRDFEIVLVNDASADGSWGVIEELAATNQRVRGIDLCKNYGQHNTLLCGLRAARYDVVVTMDDDWQHPPDEIPTLLRALDAGACDVVYGHPRKAQQSVLRNALSELMKRALARATGFPQLRTQSPFRAFRTALREAFADFQSPDILLDVLLTWGTTRFDAVPVAYLPRREGSSNYTARRLFNMTILLLTAYSTAPLRFATWLGFGVTLFGLAVFVYVLSVYLVMGSVPGFPFLASIISIFSGAQLLSLGIFGEYLSRIFKRTLDQPAYVIKRGTSGKAAEL